MIRISEKHIQEILSHVKTCIPEEGCGLIGGKVEDAKIILPIENRYHSPVRYRMDDMMLFEALLVLDQQCLDLIGIFHSHPSGPSHPSLTDIIEWVYQDAVQIICTPKVSPKTKNGTEWQLKGFQIIGKSYEEVAILIY